MLLRLAALCAFTVALVMGALSYRERARMGRLEAVAAAQRQLAATRLAPAGSAPGAGISARAPIEVAPFPEKLAKRLHADSDFHHLVHRCGVCHATPDPSLHTAAEWEAVVDRMTLNIRNAGLLQLNDEERAAVLRLLAANGQLRIDDSR